MGFEPLKPRHWIPDQELDPEDPLDSILLGNPNLPRIRSNPQNTRYWYKSWDESILKISYADFEALCLSDGYGRRQGIFLIEDIENTAVALVKRKFPELDLLFVHEHVARLEIPQEAKAKPFQEIGSVLPTRKKPNGLHFDGYCNPFLKDGARPSFAHEDPFEGFRLEFFFQHDPLWYRGSTRISCYMLRPPRLRSDAGGFEDHEGGLADHEAASGSHDPAHHSRGHLLTSAADHVDLWHEHQGDDGK